MTKSIVQSKVDELLSKKTPFSEITRITGWTVEEIWLYMDMVYRINNEEFARGNRHYCVWGMDDEKLVKTR